MRGRKPRENTVAYKVYIDAALFAEVQLLLLDPVSGKIKYGAFRKLNEQLLRQWVEERKRDVSVNTHLEGTRETPSSQAAAELPGDENPAGPPDESLVRQGGS